MRSLHLLVGAIVGLRFAIYTSEKWEKTPSHVWPPWLEYLYTAVAIILIILLISECKNAVNLALAAIVCCGVYHAYIGTKKLLLRPY